MAWMQVGAGIVGLVSLGFFALFTGYYFRNRRMSLELRRAARDAVSAQTLRSGAADDDEGVAPPTQ